MSSKPFPSVTREGSKQFNDPSPAEQSGVPPDQGQVAYHLPASTAVPWNSSSNIRFQVPVGPFGCGPEVVGGAVGVGWVGEGVAVGGGDVGDGVGLGVDVTVDVTTNVACAWLTPPATTVTV